MTKTPVLLSFRIVWFSLSHYRHPSVPIPCPPVVRSGMVRVGKPTSEPVSSGDMNVERSVKVAHLAGMWLWSRLDFPLRSHGPPGQHARRLVGDARCVYFQRSNEKSAFPSVCLSARLPVCLSPPLRRTAPSAPTQTYLATFDAVINERAIQPEQLRLQTCPRSVNASSFAENQVFKTAFAAPEKCQSETSGTIRRRKVRFAAS